MPYKDPNVQREFQRRWIAHRRAEYLAGKTCVDCGASNDLEVDHTNPQLKITHRFWSWTESRRNAELAKCVVRCKPCHLAKTHKNIENLRKHNANPQTVLLVRSLYATGQYNKTQVATLTGLGVRTVNDMLLRKSYRQLP